MLHLSSVTVEKPNTKRQIRADWYSTMNPDKEIGMSVSPPTGKDLTAAAFLFFD